MDEQKTSSPSSSKNYGTLIQQHPRHPSSLSSRRKARTTSSTSTTSTSITGGLPVVSFEPSNNLVQFEQQPLGIMMHLEAVSSTSPTSSYNNLRSGLHHSNNSKHHHHNNSSSHSSSRHHHHEKNKKSQSFLKQLLYFVFSFTGLLSLIFSYCVIGGILFRNLESAGETARASKVTQLRNITVSKLWNITDQFNVLYKENWTSLVSREIVHFQQQIIDAVKDGDVDPGSLDHLVPPVIPSKTPSTSLIASPPQAQVHSQSQWSFAGSFLYSLSLITTMGELRTFCPLVS